MAAVTIGTLEELFDRLGELRKVSRKGETLVVMRATGCANEPAQLHTLIENCDLVFAKMTAQADGRCFRMHGLDYAFQLSDKNESAREFLPNLRIALFKVLSRVGAGQSAEEGKGLTFEHFDLDNDFGAAAKFVVSYIKNSKEINPSKAPARANSWEIESVRDSQPVFFVIHDGGW